MKRENLIEKHKIWYLNNEGQYFYVNLNSQDLSVSLFLSLVSMNQAQDYLRQVWFFHLQLYKDNKFCSF